MTAANLISIYPATYVILMSSVAKAIATPCVKVCVVDGESGLCLGCFRTLAEIAKWSAFDDAARQQLMEELPTRRSRIRPEKLGLVG